MQFVPNFGLQNLCKSKRISKWDCFADRKFFVVSFVFVIIQRNLRALYCVQNLYSALMSTMVHKRCSGVNDSLCRATESFECNVFTYN